jgi:hypothetical protein
LQKLTCRPSVAPNGTPRAIAERRCHDDSWTQIFSQEDRKIGSREFFLVRRAFGAHTSNQIQGRQREPQMIRFARPSCASDLPVKKSRAAKSCPVPLRQFLQFELRVGSQKVQESV